MTELERALVALGGELEFPQTPDLTSRVRERLAGGESVTRFNGKTQETRGYTTRIVFKSRGRILFLPVAEIRWIGKRAVPCTLQIITGGTVFEKPHRGRPGHVAASRTRLRLRCTAPDEPLMARSTQKEGDGYSGSEAYPRHQWETTSDVWV